MSHPIDQIPPQDCAREKLLARGAAALSDEELLAVLLGSGNSIIDVMTLAEKLTVVVDEKGLALRAEDLKQFGAIGDAKAILILAAIEFARRRIKPEGTKIQTPADLVPLVRHYADRKQEHFLCATVNGAKLPGGFADLLLAADQHANRAAADRSSSREGCATLNEI